MGTETKEQADKPGRPRAGRPKLGADSGRQAILAEAANAFARLGFDSVSLRMLATSAGVNIALANYHFGSKQALWESVIEFLLERVRPTIARLCAIADDDSAHALRIMRFWQVFIRMNRDIPEYGQFILMESVQPGPRQDIVRERLVAPMHAAAVQLLEPAMDAGAIPRQNASLLFFMHSIAVSSVFAGKSLIHAFSTIERPAAELEAELLRAITSAMIGQLSSELETQCAEIAREADT